MFKKIVSPVKRWLWQAWPVWIALFLIVINILIFRWLHYDRGSVHKFVGAWLQIAGGVVVLFCLNKNIGLFKQGNIIQIIIQWWASRPFRRRRDTTLEVHGASHMQVSGTPSLIHVIKPRTIEERMEELEGRVEQNYQEMKAGDKELRKNIESIKQEMRSTRSEILKMIAEQKSLVASIIVGEANLQFFGILLVIYGILLPFC